MAPDPTAISQGDIVKAGDEQQVDDDAPEPQGNDIGANPGTSGDQHASGPYRAHLAEVLARRALATALDRARAATEEPATEEPATEERP